MPLYNQINFNTDLPADKSDFYFHLVIRPALTFAIVFADDHIWETAIIDQPARLQKLCDKYPGMRQSDSSPCDLHRQVADYLNGSLKAFTCNVRTFNTGFALSVIKALTKVPYGQTLSYKQLAQSASHPGAARAVGTIMKTNICPIIIPCHRVIKANGTTGNYSAGSGQTTKAWLLEIEGK